VPSEPLLCKFADGGQKKRQSQGKYLQNGRPWTTDGETVSSHSDSQQSAVFPVVFLVAISPRRFRYFQLFLSTVTLK
jgi:hypothetical protein